MSDQIINQLMKSPVAIGIAVVVCIVIIVVILRSRSENYSDEEDIKETFELDLKNYNEKTEHNNTNNNNTNNTNNSDIISTFMNLPSIGTFEEVTRAGDIIENFPSAEMNVMYSDANGNLATTRDLGLANLTVSGDSQFGDGKIAIKNGSTIYAPGRMHVHGEELLYILNKSGVMIGKEWGGSGNLTVQGQTNTDRLVVGGDLGGQFTGASINKGSGDWNTMVHNPTSGASVYMAHGGKYGMHVNANNKDMDTYALQLHGGDKHLMQVTGKGNMYVAGHTHIDGGATINGGDTHIGGNMVLSGDNSWIFHTPDDGRKIMYIAPLNDAKSEWKWGEGLRVGNQGNLVVHGQQLSVGANIEPGTLESWMGLHVEHPGDAHIRLRTKGDGGKDNYIINRDGTMKFCTGADNMSLDRNGSVGVVGNVNAGGDMTAQALTRTSGDWLRINNASGSVGRTALHGNLSVNGTMAGNSGLTVGDWSNAGEGNIKATGSISGGSISTGGSVTASSIKLGSLTLTEALNDDGSSGGLRISNANGYVDIGAKNGGWGHIYTDRPKFAFNKTLTDVVGSPYKDYIKDKEPIYITNTGTGNHEGQGKYIGFCGSGGGGCSMVNAVLSSDSGIGKLVIEKR